MDLLFRDVLQKSRQKNELSDLIDIGSCGGFKRINGITSFFGATRWVEEKQVAEGWLPFGIMFSN